MQKDLVVTQTELSITGANNLRKVETFRGRQGHQSSVVPQTLLTLPIWLHHKTAAKMAHDVSWREQRHVLGERVEVTMNVEQTNPINPKLRPDEAGCLRYFDLDVLVALGHAVLEKQSRFVTVDQAELLRWMGYSQEMRPPRERLFGSLRRMTNVSIASWPGKLDESNNDLQTFRILGTANKERVSGKRSLISVGISDEWIEALAQGRWQEMDLDCYAHLVRINKRAGLPRVLYAALTAMRKDLNHFEVPYGVLAQRWAPRMPDGRYRYSDPNNENNPLPKALQFLQEAGVIEPDLDAVQEGIIAGRFTATGVKRIRQEPRQMLIWNRDISGDVIEHKTTEQPVPPPPAGKDGSQSLIRQAFPKLRSLIKVSKQVEKGALGGSWDEGDIARLYLIAWSRHSLGKIDNPGAWAAACLRDSWPENWSKDKINERADRPELIALLKQLVADDDDDS